MTFENTGFVELEAKEMMEVDGGCIVALFGFLAACWEIMILTGYWQ